LSNRVLKPTKTSQNLLYSIEALRFRVAAAFLAAILRFSNAAFARRVSLALKAARERFRASGVLPRPRFRTRALNVVVIDFSFHNYFLTLVLLT
jgi:hypothetical protein